MSSTIVQFASSFYFGEEADEEVAIDVIRLGELKTVCSVQYQTYDASAKAGEKYHKVAGTLTFKAGEYWKSFTIRLVQDETWSPTLDFRIQLSNAKNCIIPHDGADARAKVIDDDWFPSNKYRKFLEMGKAGIDDINQWGLFWEYVRLNYGQKGIGWRTITTIIFDQMNNLYLFFLLKARTYLVNVVFNQDDEDTSSQLILPAATPGTDIDHRVLAATFVGVMYVLPMLAMHIWDCFKVRMDVEGHSRVFLQTSIFRKYLNYSEASRQKMRVSHMQVAIMNNTVDLSKAYNNLLEMAQMFGKLVLLMIFMLTQDPSGAWVLFVIPFLMLIFGCMRSRALSEASEFAGPLKKVLIDLTTETCAKYRLIADYSQRAQMNDLFERRAGELRRSLIPEIQVELNNNYFPKWLGPLFMGGYIAIEARPVLLGEVSLGVFLATLSVFSEVSNDFSSIYKHIMSINTRLDSLKKLTICFNMEAEVGRLKSLFEARREVTKAAFDICLKKPQPPPDAGLVNSDLIPIKLDRVSFRYHKSWVLKDVTLEAQQGQKVALVGPPGSGKASFLRLLAQTILPTEGSVDVPGHLRVLFVAQLPVLFDRSLWENLVFGRPDFEDHEMMLRIIEELHMPQTLELLKPELEQRAKEAAESPSKKRSSGKLGKAGGRRSSQASAYSTKTPRTISAASRSSRNGDYIPLRAVVTEDEGNDDFEDSEDEVDEERKGLLRACCMADDEEEEKVKLDEDLNWQNVLSFTEQVKLCLVRAIVMNPEVLVLHRPMHNYDESTQTVVLEVLRRHIENRGLGLPLEDWANRRPRTLFFTPESSQQAAFADVIWQIDPSSTSAFAVGAQEISHDFRPTQTGEYARRIRSTWAGPAVEGHEQAWKKAAKPISPDRRRKH